MPYPFNLMKLIISEEEMEKPFLKGLSEAMMIVIETEEEAGM